MSSSFQELCGFDRTHRYAEVAVSFLSTLGPVFKNERIRSPFSSASCGRKGKTIKKLCVLAADRLRVDGV